MPGFLYFVPHVTGPDAALDELRKAGAAHAAETVGASSPVCNQVSPGPGDLSGYVVGREGFYLFDKDSQEWQKAPVLVEGPGGKAYDGPGYWIGWRKDSPPGPDDLARQKQLDGHWVKLGDGNLWLVPVARRYVFEDGAIRHRVELSTVRHLDADGRWKADTVAEQYRRLWAWLTLFDRWLAAEEGAAEDFDFQSETEFVVEALRLNYRLGSVEASLLGLLDTTGIIGAIEAVTDRPGLEELKKKGPAPDGGSTSPGA